MLFVAVMCCPNFNYVNFRREFIFISLVNQFILDLEAWRPLMQQQLKWVNVNTFIIVNFNLNLYLIKYQCPLWYLKIICLLNILYAL